jgi:hypothetical protein
LEEASKALTGFTGEIRKVSLASETGVEERDGGAATASEVTESQLPPKNEPAIGGFSFLEEC